jgi:hypothetical protein
VGLLVIIIRTVKGPTYWEIQLKKQYFENKTPNMRLQELNTIMNTVLIKNKIHKMHKCTSGTKKYICTHINHISQAKHVTTLSHNWQEMWKSVRNKTKWRNWNLNPRLSSQQNTSVLTYSRCAKVQKMLHLKYDINICKTMFSVLYIYGKQ